MHCEWDDEIDRCIADCKTVDDFGLFDTLCRGSSAPLHTSLERKLTDERSNESFSESMNETSSQSDTPSTFPSLEPSELATLLPSIGPTDENESSSSSPSQGKDTIRPSTPVKPSFSPSAYPSYVNESNNSSFGQSKIPSAFPLDTPSSLPSMDTTNVPSIHSSSTPSSLNRTNVSENSIDSSSKALNPQSLTQEANRTDEPSLIPSTKPSSNSSMEPTSKPLNTTNNIIIIPSISPSRVPSPTSSSEPSLATSSKPSLDTSSTPSLHTSFPSVVPSDTLLPSHMANTSEPSISPSRLSSLPSSEKEVEVKEVLSKPSMSPVDTSQLPTLMISSTPSESPSVSPSSKGREKRTNAIGPTVDPTTTPKGENVTIYVAIESIQSKMGQEVIQHFEETTLYFLQEMKLIIEGATVDFISVEVISQKITTDGSGGIVNYPFRALQSDVIGEDAHHSRLLQLEQISTLVVGMVISGVITPTSQTKTGNGFDFAEIASYGFQHHFPTFIDRLEASSTFFNTSSTIHDDKDLGNRPFDADAQINTSLILILSICLGAATLIFFVFLAVLYAKRRRRVMMQLSQDMKSEDNPLKRQNVYQLDALRSPNSLEGGRPKSLQYERNEVDSKGIIPSTLQLNHAIAQQHQAQHFKSNDGEQDDETSLGLNLSPEALFEAQKQSQNFTFVADNDATTVSQEDVKFPQRKLGVGYSTSAITSSRVSSQHKPRSVSSNPMQSTPSQQLQTHEESLSYECYAPSGPLGIIVETTEQGPMIHSIKPTSPLIGIVSPGDMIIKLDDIDTSAMNAPILTQLMANMSQKTQRKITLLQGTPSSII